MINLGHQFEGTKDEGLRIDSFMATIFAAPCKNHDRLKVCNIS